MEVLPTIGKVDACITDQPYGTGWVRGSGPQNVFHAQRHTLDWDIWNLAWIPLVSAQTYALFCPDGRVGEVMQALGQPCKLRYYIKSNPRPPMQGQDAPSVEPIVIFPRVRFSYGPAHKIAYNDDALYPCQKPLSIIQWLVRDLTSTHDLILDPFFGSGSTVVACVTLGRRFIGCEQNPIGFDLACRRIEAAYKQPDLFLPRTAPTPALVQPLLFSSHKEASHG
jgi:hypothetical protein